MKNLNTKSTESLNVRAVSKDGLISINPVQCMIDPNESVTINIIPVSSDRSGVLRDTMYICKNNDISTSISIYISIRREADIRSHPSSLVFQSDRQQGDEILYFIRRLSGEFKVSGIEYEPSVLEIIEMPNISSNQIEKKGYIIRYLSDKKFKSDIVFHFDGCFTKSIRVPVIKMESGL